MRVKGRSGFEDQSGRARQNGGGRRSHAGVPPKRRRRRAGSRRWLPPKHRRSRRDGVGSRRWVAQRTRTGARAATCTRSLNDGRRSGSTTPTVRQRARGFAMRPALRPRLVPSTSAQEHRARLARGPASDALRAPALAWRRSSCRAEKRWRRSARNGLPRVAVDPHGADHAVAAAAGGLAGPPEPPVARRPGPIKMIGLYSRTLWVRPRRRFAIYGKKRDWQLLSEARRALRARNARDRPAKSAACVSGAQGPTRPGAAPCSRGKRFIPRRFLRCSSRRRRRWGRWERPREPSPSRRAARRRPAGCPRGRSALGTPLPRA